MKQRKSGISVPVHTWVVSYDIADDRDRSKVARRLEGYGDRVQYSVFECRLSNTEREGLREDLLEFIDPTRDSIRWYPLCDRCRPRARIQGRRPAAHWPESDGFVIV